MQEIVFLQQPFQNHTTKTGHFYLARMRQSLCLYLYLAWNLYTLYSIHLLIILQINVMIVYQISG
ncbi:ORF1093 [White spot syndrome virus]|uniref:Wsv193 n=3 Tax=White spot syndrome virus TaxID=342409 RepID=Q8VB14_WSSVS|nr:wsv193 [Shrimp white spot syndrome virus]AFX59570.1 wsv193 [White spot syndrome virus]AAL33197.1 wsv193 [Shrimp white spot syndrome virus]AAL89116.1 WSSV248 [Shrimp white spot syndrome virus]ATU84118.1 ORF1093 [White spot syndrome virus]AWQ60367.1 wsv193 [Shrimp white spot syndrome virus]